MEILKTAKKEILEKDIIGTDCQKAFIWGVVDASGYVSSCSFKDFTLTIENTDKQLLKKCSKILDNLLDYKPEIMSKQVDNGLKKNTYFLTVPYSYYIKLVDDPNDILLTNLLDINFTKDTQLAKHYIQGILLASSALSHPTADVTSIKSKGYNLELFVKSERSARKLSSALSTLSIDARLRKRSATYSIYIKDAEIISDFFTTLGCINALFELQNVIMLRLTSNETNRQNNCSVANLNKIAVASGKQTEAILLIDKTIGLDTLDPALKETAVARLNHPELSLEELSAYITGTPSKSCINHRLRKILAISEDL